MINNSIVNFTTVSDRISIGGQPTINQIGLLKDSNFTSIFQLAVKEVPTSTQNEAYHARQHKLGYELMDISYDHPSMRNVQVFFQTMDAYQDERVYVHCAVGYCTSALMVMYLMQRKHLSYDESRHRVVLNWNPTSTWKDLIQTVAGMDIR